jgi:hypothetical protein
MLIIINVTFLFLVYLTGTLMGTLPLSVAEYFRLIKHLVTLTLPTTEYACPETVLLGKERRWFQEKLAS